MLYVRLYQLFGNGGDLGFWFVGQCRLLDSV